MLHFKLTYVFESKLRKVADAVLHSGVGQALTPADKRPASLARDLDVWASRLRRPVNDQVLSPPLRVDYDIFRLGVVYVAIKASQTEDGKDICRALSSGLR